MSKQPYRRFQPVGEGQKEKRSKHYEDPHGIFMLHSDHVDILDKQREVSVTWEHACKDRDRTIAQLREELKQATSPDREPDFYAVVQNNGKAVDLFSIEQVAEAQRIVLSYRTGKGYHLAKLWGTIG